MSLGRGSSDFNLSPVTYVLDIHNQEGDSYCIFETSRQVICRLKSIRKSRRKSKLRFIHALDKDINQHQ